MVAILNDVRGLEAQVLLKSFKDLFLRPVSSKFRFLAIQEVGKLIVVCWYIIPLQHFAKFIACLLVCLQYDSKSTPRIVMEFSGSTRTATKKN